MLDKEFPVSLAEFKLYFLREAGLEYQPYPTFVKTAYDAGSYVLYDEKLWQSTINNNGVEPDSDIQAEDPAWTIIITQYDPEHVYSKGDIVRMPDFDTDGAVTPYYWFVALVDDPGNSPENWEKTDKIPYEYTDWVAPTAYQGDEKIIAIVNYKPGVWTSLIDDNYTEPGKDKDSWELDEEETANLDDVILDVDIERAMGEAMFKFNHGLFSEEKGKTIFLYLSMFFLVYDKQMAAAGINGNSAAGPVIHRTVGKMSVTYMESKLYSKYPSYEFLSSNDYGRKAFNLMAPYLRGGVSILLGGSTGE